MAKVRADAKGIEEKVAIENDPVIQKIRKGKKVTDEELATVFQIDKKTCESD